MKSLLLYCILLLNCHNPPQKEAVITATAAEPLRTFILRLMADRAPMLPSYKQELLISNIERVAIATFPGAIEHQRSFITIIAIESGFNERAVSSAKAVGLTQVLPRYAAPFLEYCGIKDFRVEDLVLIEMQLKAGACAFKQLLTLTGGNTAAALVAYNAGINSVSFKTLLKGGSIENKEAANYVAKYLYLKDKHSDTTATTTVKERK